MQLFEDQIGRTIQLDGVPQRIVSLVPSQTELLFDLGLDGRIVGVTRYCVHPAEGVAKVTKVGGTKKIHIQRLRALNPDLIIANKEENSAEQINALAKVYPAWVSDISTLDDALAMIRTVGQMTGAGAYEALVTRILTAFDRIPGQQDPLSVAYLIWKDPLMVAGSATFIDTMLASSGFRNVFGHRSRYPQISETELQAAAPDVIILSSEPYAFNAGYVPEFQALCPGSRILVADATFFSWYGSRLQHAPTYFAHLMTYLQMH